MEMYAARFSVGPIPDAEELERYKAVQPDLPERISVSLRNARKWPRLSNSAATG